VNKITTLEATRGFAALLVLLYHATGSMFEYYYGYPTLSWFRFGHAGVEFFFVLSGFIILYVHREDLGRPHRIQNYTWRRFVRIYPLYWTVTTAMLAAAMVVPSIGNLPALHWRSVFYSFLLLHHADYPVVSVAWSLEHEILFYALFGIAILNLRIGAALFVLWAVAIAYSRIMGEQSLLFDFIGRDYNMLFFVGMAAAAVVRRWRIPAPRTILVIGAILFFTGGALEDYGFDLKGFAGRLIYGFGAAGIVLGLVEAERSRKWRAPRLLMLVGAASYAIYLVHLNSLIVIEKTAAVTGLGRLLPEGVILCLLIMLPICVGLACHVFFERPVLDFLRQWHPGVRVQRSMAGPPVA